MEEHGWRDLVGVIFEVAAHEASHGTVEHGEVEHVGDEHGAVAHVGDDSGRPEAWGWHHEFRSGRQIGGWISFLVLFALLTTTHYNRAGNVAIIIFMVVLAAGLLWDRHRRKTQWRS